MFFSKLMDKPTVVSSLKITIDILYKLLIYFKAWTHLKGIILNKISQSQKVTYDIIPFMWHSEIGKTTMTENRAIATRSYRFREDMTIKWQNERVLRSDTTILYPDSGGIWIWTYTSLNLTPKNNKTYSMLIWKIKSKNQQTGWQICMCACFWKWQIKYMHRTLGTTHQLYSEKTKAKIFQRINNMQVTSSLQKAA